MKKPGLNLSLWVSIFILAIAVIGVLKLMENLDVILAFLNKLMIILTPFIIGFVVAFLLYLPCTKLENIFKKSKNKFILKNSKGFSIVVIYLVLLLIIITILSFGVPYIMKAIMNFSSQVPGYYRNITEFIKNINTEEGIFSYINIDSIIKNLSERNLFSFINLENISSYVQGLLNVASAFANIFLVTVISIYMLIEKEHLINGLNKLLKLIINEKYINIIKGYLKISSKIFYGFVYGQVLDAILLATIVGVALTLFKVPNGPIMGIIIGIFNVIPYFGSIIGSIIVIFFTLLSGNIPMTIGVSIFLIVMQQIDGNVFQPNIIGDSIGISPFWILFAVIVGGGFFGVIGMILFVPLTAIIRIILVDIIDYNEKRKALKES